MSSWRCSAAFALAVRHLTASSPRFVLFLLRGSLVALCHPVNAYQITYRQMVHKCASARKGKSSGRVAAIGSAAGSAAGQHDGDVDLISVLYRHGQLLRIRALEVKEDLDVSSQLPFLLEQRLTNSWILLRQVVKAIT